MSKFGEKLEHVYRGATSPMGFRRIGEEEIPQVLIVTSLSDISSKAAKIGAGADGALIGSKALSIGDIKQLTDVLGEVPLGVIIQSSDPTDINDILKAGCDFIVFDIKTPLTMVNREGMGKILRIEPTMDLGMARAIAGFPLSIDGVLIGGEDSTLTVERLLICQRYADLMDKPLITTVCVTVTSNELSNLCQAGVKGIVVPSSITAKTAAELKKAIACMPKPSRRKTKAAPILPRVISGPEIVADEEEEEDI